MSEKHVPGCPLHRWSYEVGSGERIPECECLAAAPPTEDTGEPSEAEPIGPHLELIDSLVRSGSADQGQWAHRVIRQSWEIVKRAALRSRLAGEDRREPDNA